MVLQLITKLLLAFLLIQANKASPLQDSKSTKDDSVRLKPKSYTLNLQIFPEDNSYTGEVIINLITLEKTNILGLSAHKNVTIKDTKVNLLKASSAGLKKGINVQKIERCEETNILTVILESPLYVGAECEVTISFSGKINTDDTIGLFKKTYVDTNTKQTKWIIGSRLEPNYTQAVFPCFDDTTYKVPIEVSIQRPVKLNSLSTMPLLKSTDIGKDWVKDVFATTPPILVSSLAIFVSDMVPVNFDKPDLQIRIWPASEQNRKELVYKAHTAFQDLFGVKYPIPKLDFVVLPSTADTNVYRSLGLIIFSYNNRDTELGDLLSEVGGQWIGNLVAGSQSTPEAKLIEEAFVNVVTGYLRSKDSSKERKKVLDFYAAGDLYSTYYELGAAIQRDDVLIRQYTNSSKARFVFKMLLATLTEQTFTKAFKNFILQCQLKKFQMDDFWDALNEQAHADKTLPTNLSVKKIATYWLDNYRLPYVTATRNYEANSVNLQQQLFIRKRPYKAVDDKDKHLVWTIPIVLKTENNLDFENKVPNEWLETQEDNLQNVADAKQFIIINPDEIAPYMVNYDDANWNKLANFLQSTEQRSKIPIITRAKLIHDALNLAYAGKLDFGTAFNITTHLKDETEYSAWRPFFIMFDHLGRHIGGTKVLKKYKKYVNLITTPLYEQLKTTTRNESLAREFLHEVRSVLRQTGNQQLLKESNAAYAKWMDNPNSGYKNVESHLCTIFEFGTQEQWDFSVKVLQNMKDKPDIDRSYLFKCTVGCTKDQLKIKKFLNMTLFEQSDAFTDEDFNYAVFMLTGDAEGFLATFDYLRENWDVLKARLQNKPEIWKQLVYTATNLHKTQDGLDQVSAFYSQHRGQFGAAEKTITDSLIKIKEEVQWTNANLKNFESWLDNYILKNSPQSS